MAFAPGDPRLTLKFGDYVRLTGWLDEGGEFIYVGPDDVPDTPWAYVICIKEDGNNFWHGRLSKANAGLAVIAEPEF